MTSFGSMFAGCTSLTELDLSSFDTNKVTHMNAMFCGCIRLGRLNLRKKIVMDNVTNSNSMFLYANVNIKIKAIESTVRKIKDITSYTDSNFE